MSSSLSTIVEFNVVEHTHRKITFKELDLSSDKIYWVHADVDDKEFFKQAIATLNLSDDLVELCLEEDSIPKFIDYDDALTLQIQSILDTEIRDTQTEVSFSDLVLHLTDKYCFTASKAGLPAVNEFENNYSKAVRFAKTPCFILFIMLDNVVNDFGKVLFNMELLTDKLDLRVTSEEKNIYNEVMDVKHQLILVKRYSVAIREILMRISSRNISVVSEQCKLSLYNLSNHSHTVVHEADIIREILNGLLGQIDNALMQRMSQTMKILTAFAAILLPLTLITGIYGMNFHFMPELTWRYGYLYALSLILIVGVLLFLLFKHKKWV